MRLLFVIALAVLIAACGTTGSRDGTPSRRLDPERIKDAVPRRERITAAGNKSPYTVMNQTFRVLPSARGYRARGVASWYGTKFHGRDTANGERYDVYKMTAAHTTLPIPTYVQVTNLENGRKAIVRVNDRGPFAHGRLIDLSYAAATKLGFAHKGTAQVEVEAIDVDNWPPSKSYAARPDPQSAVRSKSPGTMRPADVGSHFVQAGAFASEASAEALRRQLSDVLGHTVAIEPTLTHPALYRVRVGPLPDRAAAEQVRDALLAGHVSEARIVQ